MSESYGITLISATVADYFDTISESGYPYPVYVTMSPAGAVGLQMSSADEVRTWARLHGGTATTTLIGTDENRKVLTEAIGTWTTSEAQLNLTAYSVVDLDSMTGDDAGTDRLLGDVNPWRASRG